MAWGRHPPGWTTTRRRILNRDSHRCYRCGGHATQVDHIIPFFEGGSDRDENLAAICQPCHKRKTILEGMRARWPATQRRPEERHPGLR